jgi:hypothetical protein
VVFEPTIPEFERAKTVHALDHAATMTSSPLNAMLLISTRHKISLLFRPYRTFLPQTLKRYDLSCEKSQHSSNSTRQGRAITQAVSRRLPTAAARVRAQVRSCGICGGQSGTGAGFLRALRFTLPILIPPTAPQSSSIIRGWNNRPISGRRTTWTQV